MSKEIIAVIFLLFLLILFLLPNFKIVKENEQLLVERMGSFFKVIDKPGIYFLFPLFDRVIERETLLPQKRTLPIDTYTLTYTYQITDIKMYGYYALDPIKDLESYLAQMWSNGNPDIDTLKESIKDRGMNLLDIQKVTNNNF